MNLEKIIIKLRSRNPWEAMDLGTKLVVFLLPKLIVPWLTIILVFLFVSIYVQISGYPIFGLFIFWLFKPIYDSLLLYIISNELFSESLSLKKNLINYKQWLIPGVKHSLYWWRLSPIRSFVMPVTLLEGLSSKPRGNRIEILKRESAGHAFGLTFLAINFELLTNLSVYVIYAFMVPDELATQLTSIISGEDIESGLIMNTLFYSLSVFAIEPIYLTAGFMLYLNRRVKLEAWDIEIAFKNINNRLENNIKYASY